MENALEMFSGKLRNRKRRKKAGRKKVADKKAMGSAAEEITLDLEAQAEALLEYAEEVRTLVDIGYSGSREIIE